MLEKITRSPYLNLLSGIILVATASCEVVETLHEGGVGAHHGVFLFGVIQVVKAIPEIMHGFKEIEEAEELNGRKKKLLKKYERSE